MRAWRSWIQRALGACGMVGAGAEVAGDDRREPGLVGEQLVRERAPLEPEARGERREVEPGGAAAGVGPVDEDDTVLEQAQVVAADVTVEERGTGQRRRRGGVQQPGERRLEPGGGGEPQGQEVFRSVRDLLPVAGPGRVVFERGQGGVGQDPRHAVERVDHPLVVTVAPRRRPVACGQVLEDHEGFGAVVETEHPRRERGVQHRAPPVLLPDPAGGVRRDTHLDEGTPTIGENDDPPLCGGETARGEPC